MPIVEEVCRRSIKFARDCVLHESGLIKRIASHGIYNARSESPVGRDILFCIDRYCFHCRVYYLIHILSLVHIFVLRCYVKLYQLRQSSFLTELNELRDGMDKFSYSFMSSYTEPFIRTCISTYKLQLFSVHLVITARMLCMLFIVSFIVYRPFITWSTKKNINIGLCEHFGAQLSNVMCQLNARKVFNFCTSVKTKS